MKIEFEWNDLVDLVDDASSDDINRIAHAISDIINVVNSNDGGNVDLSDYYTKDYINSIVEAFENELTQKESLSVKILAEVEDTLEDAPYYSAKATDAKIKEEVEKVVGDIESALNELHNYAQSLIGGDAS